MPPYNYGITDMYALPNRLPESQPIDVDAITAVDRPNTSAQPLWLVLASRLRCADSQLPSTVPLGALTDAFAEITGNPTHGVVDVQEAWEEEWNPSLHRVFSYNSSAEGLVDIVRRGKAGLEGFGDWVEAIGQAGVDVEILRERVEKLLEAVRIMCVFYSVLFMTCTHNHFTFLAYSSTGFSSSTPIKQALRNRPISTIYRRRSNSFTLLQSRRRHHRHLTISRNHSNSLLPSI